MGSDLRRPRHLLSEHASISIETSLLFVAPGCPGARRSLHLLNHDLGYHWLILCARPL